MYSELRLKKGRERSVLNRHPWIFSGAALKIPDSRNGEIVEVVSYPGEILGYGFFSPGSQIICRMFEFTGLRSGGFENSYFSEKIYRAFHLRQRIINNDTDCYRLLNAEGDFFPGLTVDIFGDTAVIQVQIKGAELLLETAAGSLNELGFKNICLKNPGANDTEGVDIPFSFILGSAQAPLIVKENGHRFKVDIEHGQKTGFFLDQRENRSLAGKFSQGRRVLNAFCYTGGFSVYSMAGGADLVHSVDISADAVDQASENISINPRTKGIHQSIKADCFDYLRSMDDNFYDMIILDPPAFVKSSRGVDKGARGYKDINLRAMRKCRSDSLLFTFSCSHHVTADLFRKIVFSAASDSGRDVRVLAQLSQGGDHPFSIYHPEGEYLKGLFLHIA